MASIRILDTFTANRIAAGEVVERPASIVKELVENAIDAGSTSISVVIRSGGIDRIQVSDNGSGIEPEDVPLAFERHATSKIVSPRDLDAIATLGFRGEALCSIAAVAQVELRSRRTGYDEGYRVRIAAGEIIEQGAFGCPDGTSIDVMHLFYNTPARLKFLKKPAVEAGAIGDVMLRNVLAHPGISFLYRLQSAEDAPIKTVYHSAGDGDLLNALYCVYGREVIETLHSVTFRGGADQSIGITGYVSRSDGAKHTRGYQSFFVNGRYVLSPLLSRAVQEAFGTRLMGGRFPLCALSIDIPFDAVDVNIHPHKTAVRFKDEAGVAQAMRAAIATSLGERAAIPWRAPVPKDSPPFKSRMTPKQPLSGRRIAPDDVVVTPRDWRVVSPPESPTRQKQTEPTEYPINAQKTPPTPQISPSVPVCDGEAVRTLDDIPKITIEAEPAVQPGVLFARESATYVAPRFDLLQDAPTPLRILGQAFGTYVIAEQGDALYLVDQHAAHERMVYDACLQSAGKDAAQRLLIPCEWVLEPRLVAVLHENVSLLRDIGFRFAETDDNATVVRVEALPHFLGVAEGEAFLDEALAAIAAGGDPASDARRERLAEYACKHAVRAKEVLREDEMRALLSRFEDMGEWHCPHGRPIIVRLSQKEIEKMFRRKL